MKKIEGNIIDIYNNRIFPGTICIDHGIITDILENSNSYQNFIAPGFIDAHVHIESSMLVPEEFSKLAISKGTVAVINDPHEIANVLGIEGIRFMIENSWKAPIKIFFSVPSCVPATSFDYSGAEINSDHIEELLQNYSFVSLSEMMNISGVLQKDAEVWRKLKLAEKYNIPIDGHAPGIIGEVLKQYVSAGISTDHESVSLSEALEKISLGMKILIREGSAAKNYEALKSLINSHPYSLMFCTDDSHPGDLIHCGHIDKIVRRAIADGFDLFQVLRIASLHPIQHYHLPVGTLRIGDPADFCIFEDLKSFSVSEVYIQGELKYSSSWSMPDIKAEVSDFSNLNQFNRKLLQLSDLRKPITSDIVSIKVYDGELITDKVIFSNHDSFDNFESDLDRDILKIIYLNRYENKPPQIAFIHGIGLKKGAFASSISHDSHNIIAVGCNDQYLLIALNSIISAKGGLSVASEGEVDILSLPIAGIMTDENGEKVAMIWNKLIQILHHNGCILDSPFMTLSFMALIVIPELKIGERGLFEYSKFKFLAD